jgi:predicted GNAT family acetyltransferase
VLNEIGRPDGRIHADEPAWTGGRVPMSSVVNNTERQRFEVHEGSLMARLTYSIDGDVIDLLDTKVPKEMEGRGVGSALIAAALRYATDEGLMVRTTCPFAKAYLDRHPPTARLTGRLDD